MTALCTRIVIALIGIVHVGGLRGSATFGHGGSLLANRKGTVAVQPPVPSSTPAQGSERKSAHGTKSSPAGDSNVGPPSQGSSSQNVAGTSPAAPKGVAKPGPPPAVATEKSNSSVVDMKLCGPVGISPAKPDKPASSGNALPGAKSGSGFLPKPLPKPAEELPGVTSNDADDVTQHVVAAVPNPVSKAQDCPLQPADDGDKQTTQQVVEIANEKQQQEQSRPVLPKQKPDQPSKPQRPGNSELRVFFGVSPLTLLNKICHGQRNSCTAEFGDSLYHAVRQVTQDSTFTRDRVKIGGVSARSGGVEQVVVIRNDGDLQLAQAVKQVLLEIPRCTNTNSPSPFPICQTATGKQLARHNVKTEVTSIKYVR